MKKSVKLILVTVNLILIGILTYCYLSPPSFYKDTLTLVAVLSTFALSCISLHITNKAQKEHEYNNK